MLDIKFIRDNQELVKKAARDKRVEVDVDQLLELDKRRVKLLREIEQFQAERNRINDEIKKTENKDELVAKGREVKEKLGKLQPKLEEVEENYNQLMRQVPNVPAEDVPVGKDESENKVLRQWGDVPQFDFKPKEHWKLGADLDVIDMERAAKISGSRFGYLKGELVLLEFALVQYALETLTDEKMLSEIAQKANIEINPKPFVPVVPPVLIKPEVFDKMARLDPEDDKYHTARDNLYLVGSAEHTLGSMHLKETFAESELPRRYVGFSTAFRREAGSYGKDVRGILRVHQFDKAELESFTVPEDSIKEQNFIVAIQEHLMQSLGIPYQIVILCTGDMGAPDARQIDIEAWLPGQGKYRETHTSDLMTDYQARRLGTRVKRADGRAEYVHMNDATVFAIGRTLIAIMENYQQKDGSIAIPQVLRKYLPGGIEKITRKQ